MPRLLIADDHGLYRKGLRCALEAAIPDADVTEADGFDGALARLEDSGSFDLVLLDLNMPDVHGLEVLRFIRGQAGMQNLPVVILTTRGDEDSRAAAVHEGATLYLTKPFAPAMIVSQIKPLLHQSTA